MVLTWRYELPNCFFLVSQHYAPDLGNALFGTRPSYLLTEIGTNYWGALLADSWYLFEKKDLPPNLLSPPPPPPPPPPQQGLLNPGLSDLGHDPYKGI